MKVTLKDLSKILGISESAVSMALNGKEGVSEKTRQAVKSAAIEHGYMPDVIARSLAVQKSKTIGLVVPDIENPYYGKMVRCIGAYVRELGYSLNLSISNEDMALEKEIIWDFVSRQVEGIIVSPINRPCSDLSHYELPKKRRLPVAFIAAHYASRDSNDGNVDEMPYVMVNLEQGAFNLVSYLLGSGHRRIAFMTAQRDIIAASSRLNGYKRAFNVSGIEVDESLFVTCTHVNFEQAYIVASRLLKEKKDIDAIITANDYMALGVLKALYEQGIRVPQDISVAGCDDIVYASVANVPITTVLQDIERMSRLTVNMIFDMIHGNRLTAESIMIEPELIIRESTAIRQLR